MMDQTTLGTPLFEEGMMQLITTVSLIAFFVVGIALTWVFSRGVDALSEIAEALDKLSERKDEEQKEP